MNSSEEILRSVPPDRYNALPRLHRERSVETTLVIDGMAGQEWNAAVPVRVAGVEREIAFS
jgi:hypothetical protein